MLLMLISLGQGILQQNIPHLCLGHSTGSQIFITLEFILYGLESMAYDHMRYMFTLRNLASLATRHQGLCPLV